ncbi:MAG: methyltransferase regulatory domain-containing protein [Nitrosomonas sp.]|nr:methyltransferase regulatory domain-containing protein [Nitrosomonas sp.]
MNEWNEGYVAEVAYTYGYYAELNPLRMRLPFLNHGLVFPEIKTACELGFGQGVSININAAASNVEWYGTDFNPTQVCFAQQLLNASEARAKLYDDSFLDFCSRTDLPNFDMIALHGIWSWTSDVNKKVIVDFVRRKLNTGGVLYISYNSYPGWAPLVPFRDLMNRHVDIMGAKGQGINRNIHAALDFISQMLTVNPSYTQRYPKLLENFEKIKKQNHHYLAHEYFNRDWDCMTFGQISDYLYEGKLNYACSATYLDHIAEFNLSDEQVAFLAGIPNEGFREDIKDFIVNNNFRRDYWAKGLRVMNQIDRARAIREIFVIMVTPREWVELKVKVPRGEATLAENIYNPLLEALSDHQPIKIGQLEQNLERRGVSFTLIIQALIILCGKGDVMIVQDETITQKSKQYTDKLNLHLMNMARRDEKIKYLASPVISEAVLVNRFQQLFLLARHNGLISQQESVQFAWQHLSASNQRIIKNGVTIESDEDNVAELNLQAKEFFEKRLPILKALQIA